MDEGTAHIAHISQRHISRQRLVWLACPPSPCLLSLSSLSLSLLSLSLRGIASGILGFGMLLGRSGMRASKWLIRSVSSRSGEFFFCASTRFICAAVIAHPYLCSADLAKRICASKRLIRALLLVRLMTEGLHISPFECSLMVASARYALGS